MLSESYFICRPTGDVVVVSAAYGIGLSNRTFERDLATISLAKFLPYCSANWLYSKNKKIKFVLKRKKKLEERLTLALPCVVIHDNSHTRHAQPISFRHHPLPKPIRNMIRTQQPSRSDQQMKRHKRKRHKIPPLQHNPLKNQIPKLTSR